MLGQRDLGVQRRVAAPGQDLARRAGRARPAAHLGQQDADLHGMRDPDLGQDLEGRPDAVQVQPGRGDGHQDDRAGQDGRADDAEVAGRRVHDDVLVAGPQVGQPDVHVPGGHADHGEGQWLALLRGLLAPAHQRPLRVAVHRQGAAQPVQDHGQADRRRRLAGASLGRHEPQSHPAVPPDRWPDRNPAGARRPGLPRAQRAGLRPAGRRAGAARASPARPCPGWPPASRGRAAGVAAGSRRSAAR